MTEQPTEPEPLPPVLFRLTLRVNGAIEYEGKAIADRDFAHVLRVLADAIEVGVWEVGVT